MRRLLDAAVYSSVWVAAAAAALCVASSMALGGRPEPAVAWLAFFGTLVGALASVRWQAA